MTNPTSRPTYTYSVTCDTPPEEFLSLHPQALKVEFQVIRTAFTVDYFVDLLQGHNKKNLSREQLRAIVLYGLLAAGSCADKAVDNILWDSVLESYYSAL